MPPDKTCGSCGDLSVLREDDLCDRPSCEQPARALCPGEESTRPGAPPFLPKKPSGSGSDVRSSRPTRGAQVIDSTVRDQALGPRVRSIARGGSVAVASGSSAVVNYLR